MTDSFRCWESPSYLLATSKRQNSQHVILRSEATKDLKPRRRCDPDLGYDHSMHLAVDTSTYKLTSLGKLLMTCALLIGGGGALRHSRLLASAGAILLVLGLLLIVWRSTFLILARSSIIRAKIDRTLALLGLSAPFQADRYLLPKPKMEILMRPIGGATLLVFRWNDEDDKRQRYIMETLIRYLRTIRIIV